MTTYNSNIITSLKTSISAFNVQKEMKQKQKLEKEINIHNKEDQYIEHYLTYFFKQLDFFVENTIIQKLSNNDIQTKKNKNIIYSEKFKVPKLNDEENDEKNDEDKFYYWSNSVINMSDIIRSSSLYFTKCKQLFIESGITLDFNDGRYIIDDPDEQYNFMFAASF